MTSKYSDAAARTDLCNSSELFNRRSMTVVWACHQYNCTENTIAKTAQAKCHAQAHLVRRLDAGDGAWVAEGHEWLRGHVQVQMPDTGNLLEIMPCHENKRWVAGWRVSIVSSLAVFFDFLKGDQAFVTNHF